MTDSYATAKAAYRELRSAIGPWAKANAYRRWAGTQAGWQKPTDAEQRLLFKFHGYSMVNPDTGNSYYGLVQLEPLDAPGSTILRQSDFGCCLVQAELDELARIQGAINRRRPPLPWYLKKDATADSLLGHGLRELYEPTPQYREGHMISFRYHGLQDAREFAAFVAAMLPQALERFLRGRVAKPVDDTPPHLKPKWLTTLGKPSGG
ncbi:MAG: hypothetical protein HY616_10385 [Candidatus Rokubacteria bacterium]|nr:hypothetical protein [Candidatus Rokubacteria bacterium]